MTRRWLSSSCLACALLCLSAASLGPRASAQTPPTAPTAQSLDAIFRGGNEAFFQSDFRKASQQYQRLVEAGVRDADVYFNLGSAHARLGELGQAILSFERAALLAPNDAELAQALSTARTALGKRRSERQGEATVRTRPPLIEALVRPYHENTLAGLTLAFDLLCFGLLIARRYAGGEALRMGLALGAFGCALLLAVTGSALFLKRGGLENGHAAVVLRESAELREGPDPRAHVRGAAHEGENARALQRDGAFLRVRTAAGQEGWMHGNDIGVITRD